MANAVVLGADPDRRALLRGLLQFERHRVVAEGTAEQVLAALREDAPVDLLLIDGDHGTRAWRDVTEEIRHERPDVEVVLVTRESPESLGDRARAAGIHAVLRPPFLLEEFEAAVGRPLARSGAFITPPRRRDPPSPP